MKLDERNEHLAASAEAIGAGARCAVNAVFAVIPAMLAGGEERAFFAEMAATDVVGAILNVCISVRHLRAAARRRVG